MGLIHHGLEPRSVILVHACISTETAGREQGKGSLAFKASNSSLSHMTPMLTFHCPKQVMARPNFKRMGKCNPTTRMMRDGETTSPENITSNFHSGSYPRCELTRIFFLLDKASTFSHKQCLSTSVHVYLCSSSFCILNLPCSLYIYLQSILKCFFRDDIRIIFENAFHLHSSKILCVQTSRFTFIFLST